MPHRAPRLQVPVTLAGLAMLVALASCAPHPLPALPDAAPDVQGWVAGIQGSFEGGGTLTVRAAAGADAPVERVEIPPGVPVLERRAGKLRRANLSRLAVGDRVSAWWAGEPTRATPPREGRARVLVIERT